MSPLQATEHGGSRSWREVVRRDEGRLLYSTRHGRRGLMVHYRSRADQVILHLPSYVEAANYLDGQHVALEVWGADASARQIEGIAAVVADDAVTEEDAARLEQWPPGVSARYVVIDVATARGSRSRP